MEKLIKNIKVPTGNICISLGEKGKLEFLTVGDYGKERNVKASFLGLDNEINGVKNGDLMPLTEKWVTTISTQYGCSMGCKFCDVPKVGPGLNATKKDLTNQVINSLLLHPEIGSTKRFNLHYARMGEPTFNFNVIEHARGLMKEIRPYIGRSHVHPVVSTMLPKSNAKLMEFLQDWCELKNYTFRGSAGLQLSINSTCDDQRHDMFNGSSLFLDEIAEIGRLLPDPVGRKYALNFALADNYEVDAVKLLNWFSPKKFMVKITPLHKNKACENNNIATTGGYEYYTPYKQAEKDLKEAGFDVLVFIPSLEEDEGRITCGNAILSGSMPKEYIIIE
jgi:23S rRNA (adenine2503-C2)-methyltransferase